MLTAAVRLCGAQPIELGIVRDEPPSLRERLAQGLEADLLVVSGGVSAGDLDLVPEVLAELGVEAVFHKVRLKPGKPLWFGIRRGERPDASGSDASGSAETLVFGLPGNPVSSFVCFEIFVRPAIARLAGQDPSAKLCSRPARLTSQFVHRGDRPTFHPALLETALLETGHGQASSSVAPLRWAGSADLRGMAAANALIMFPAGDRTFAVGELVDVMPLRPPE
jgi:molybdopterin molybdotransferase